jgi:phosphatidylglycerophosphate synthase
MIDSNIKKTKFNEKISKFVSKFLLNKYTANQLTILALFFGIFSAILLIISSLMELPSGFQDALFDFWENPQQFWTWQWASGDIVNFIAVIFLILSFFIDILDGSLARLTKPTKFGGILDIFCDRMVESVLLIAIIVSRPEELMWAGLFSLSSIISCITIFLLLGGVLNSPEKENLDSKQKAIYYSTGLMERTETFIFIMVMVIFSPLRLILLWVFAILVYFTAFQRLLQAYQLLKEKKNNNSEKIK